MKALLPVLAGAGLLATPILAAPSLAAAHGRGGYHVVQAGFRPGGGYHFGSPAAARYHAFPRYAYPHYAYPHYGYPYYRYRGWGYPRAYWWSGPRFGLVLSPAYYDPWFYDPWYGAPWYYSAPSYSYSYTTYYGDPPPSRDDRPQDGASPAPAPPASSTAPAACGAWSWNVAADRYDWKPC